MIIQWITSTESHSLKWKIYIKNHQISCETLANSSLRARVLNGWARFGDLPKFSSRKGRIGHWRDFNGKNSFKFSHKFLLLEIVVLLDFLSTAYMQAAQLRCFACRVKKDDFTMSPQFTKGGVRFAAVVVVVAVSFCFDIFLFCFFSLCFLIFRRLSFVTCLEAVHSHCFGRVA